MKIGAVEQAEMVLFWELGAAEVLSDECPAPLAGCIDCHALWRDVESASVRLDMVLAAESDQRIRRAVAW